MEINKQSGFAHLTAILALGAVFGIIGGYFQLKATRGLKASVEMMNQFEGYYASEIAALKTYQMKKAGVPVDNTATATSSSNTVTSLSLNNDIGEGACGGQDCASGYGTTYAETPRLDFANRFLSLKELFARGKVRHGALIRRHLASSSLLTSPDTNTFCGAVTYSENTAGARTCVTTEAAPPSLIPTNTVGVAFEDAHNFADDGTGWGPTWLTTDLRACITGDFAVDPNTHKIYSTSPTPQAITIASEKRPLTGCRHTFYIEVYDSAGTKKYESLPYETQSNAPPQATTVMVSQGDEIRLGWEDINSGIYGSLCAFNGRDSSTRLTDTRPQTSGPSQTLPAPKFFYGSCGDWNGLCSSTTWHNSRQEIRDLANNYFAPTQILGSNDWVGADALTRDKVCQMIGEQRAISYTTSNNLFTAGRNTVLWNGTGWVKVPASSNNTRLETIRCGCL